LFRSTLNTSRTPYALGKKPNPIDGAQIPLWAAWVFDRVHEVKVKEIGCHQFQ
jgi:hypothetical protein